MLPVLYIQANPSSGSVIKPDGIMRPIKSRPPVHWAQILIASWLLAFSCGHSHAQTITAIGEVEIGSGFITGDQPSPLHAGTQLVVGVSASGTLIVSGGGEVIMELDNPFTPTMTSYIGAFSGSVGDVTVTGSGSVFHSGNFLTVGNSGTGTLTIENGGAVINDGAALDGTRPYARIGFNAGSSGVVNVNGEGSTWTTGDQLILGGEGTGILNIAGGGSVIVSAASTLGAQAGGIGSALVTGPGSIWTAGNVFVVGNAGQGSLTISNGGTVASVFQTVIGAVLGGENTVTVTGAGSSLAPGELLSVGLAGQGALIISEGGSVTNLVSAQLGGLAGSFGSAAVSGAGSTWNSGANLLVGDGGTGVLTIADGGVVTATSSIIADEAGSVGTLNLDNGGDLTTDSVTFGAGTGVINFNSVGTRVFAPTITGAGTLNMLSGITTLTADSSAFSGSANIGQAALIVNGMLGGVINVGDGGLLGGTGTVGTTIVANGGTLAPGNSIGTVNINGNLSFNPGSVYRAEVDPAGNNDLTLVSGAADLSGGRVDVLAASGAWQIATGYTILTAAGGLNGTRFLDVSSNLQFLEPVLTYDANNVMLALNLIVSPPNPNEDPVIFAAIAETPNQRRAAESIDDFFLNHLDTDNSLIAKLLGLDKATAPLTITQLPGEIHVSLAGVLLDDSRFLRDAANNRLRSAFGDVAAPPIPVLAYGPDGVEPQTATTEQFAVWGQGFGSWADWKSNDQVPGVDRSVGGFLIGGDAAFGDRARIGVFSGYSRTSIDESGLDASADVDNIHLGIYGGAEFGALSLRSGASYTWHVISTDRFVQFTGSQEHLTAGYHGGTAQIFGELGYGIQLSSVALEPFANLAYANLHIDSFTEDGGTSALTATSSNTNITFSTLGLRAATQLSVGSVEVAFRGMLGWRHAYGDVTPEASLAFSGMGDFEISGLPIARDAALLEAGLDVDLTPATTFGLTYQGQIASDIQDHGFRADLTVRF